MTTKACSEETDGLREQIRKLRARAAAERAASKVVRRTDGQEIAIHSRARACADGGMRLSAGDIMESPGVRADLLQLGLYLATQDNGRER